MRSARARLAATAAPVLALGAFTAGGLLPATSAAADGFDKTLTSATHVDLTHEQTTLPLFGGTSHGRPVWYVLTDDSNEADAQARGLDWAPKLANALGTRAVQRVTVRGGVVDFPGTVDFAPVRRVVPGPPGHEFVGGSYTPGARGDAAYSPLITTGNGIVLNATQVANGSGIHDSVVTLDTVHRRVTLKTFFGFWNGHTTVYLHQDASSPVVAAAEGSNFAPNLDAAPGLGSNEDTSARSAIIPIVNGPVGAHNPQRQGLNSALRGEGDPLNINQEVPNRGHRYSPVWDVHPLVWTQAAINAGERTRLTSGSDVAGAVQSGQAVSAGTGPANEDLGGLRAAGFISNCPIVGVS